LKNIKKIAVLTSGGDAPGMNCAIRSVTRFAVYKKLDVVGVARGFQGLIDKEFQILTPRSVSNIISRGGTILKTARSEKFLKKEYRERAYHNLVEDKIDALIIIGGNGSFNGASVFNQEFDFPVAGIPGTIDNDVSGTQRTLGFDTALNTAMDAIDKIKDTATSMDRIFIIEVMGRSSGAIAAYSALSGGAEDIIIPNEPPEVAGIIKKIEQGRIKGKRSWIIIVAEGAAKAENLAKEFREFVSDVRVTVIGHIQRGGVPSAFDRFLGAVMGKTAVEVLLNGKTQHVVGWAKDQTIVYPLKEAVQPKKEDFTHLHELIHILT